MLTSPFEVFGKVHQYLTHPPEEGRLPAGLSLCVCFGKVHQYLPRKGGFVLVSPFEVFGRFLDVK